MLPLASLAPLLITVLPLDLWEGQLYNTMVLQPSILKHLVNLTLLLWLLLLFLLLGLLFLLRPLVFLASFDLGILSDPAQPIIWGLTRLIEVSVLVVLSTVTRVWRGRVRYVIVVFDVGRQECMVLTMALLQERVGGLAHAMEYRLMGILTDHDFMCSTMERSWCGIKRPESTLV